MDRPTSGDLATLGEGGDVLAGGNVVTEVGSQKPVKLSCRNLWKVYGAQAGRLGQVGVQFSGDRKVACDKLQRAGQFPAVIDASFDIHVGEIFVIMGLSGSG